MAGEDWPAVQAAAVKEGKLSFYHNLRPQGVEQLLIEFRKANPGIQTEQIRLGSAPLIERFSTEFNAGRNIADVLLSFPDDAMFAGVDKGGWATEWTPPELSAFKPVINRGNKAFAVHTSRNVIIYNKQRVKPADAPKEWTDLWDPKWKGKVGMDPPWRSIAVQGVIALWVKNGIADAAQKLKANDVRFFEGSAGVFQAVLRGDVMVATRYDGLRARNAVPPLTISQFRMATEVALAAAENGMPELSQRAIQSAMSGGIPVPDPDVTSTPNQRRMVIRSRSPQNDDNDSPLEETKVGQWRTRRQPSVT
jgi:hypothetical protein